MSQEKKGSKRKTEEREGKKMNDKKGKGNKR